MPLINISAELGNQAMEWRRDLHAHPELLFDLPRTSRLVAEKLRDFGCDEVITGIAQKGVVGIIRGLTDTKARVVGLRADMDALPMDERGEGDRPHRSVNAGKMHACGHDGHTAMLLGAAQYLASTRNFDGTVVVIFQPAEEGGGGGKVMVDEGMLDRFGIQEVYAMHNKPGLPVGTFALKSGPILAASDRFVVTITGKGGHGAMPHMTIDPVIISAHLALALQTIVSRNVDPLQSVVLSVTQIHGGSALNVIPDTATLGGTARTFRHEMRSFVEKRVREISEHVARTYGAEASVEWRSGVPVTENDPDRAAFAATVAADLVTSSGVNAEIAPEMGGEDFSYMLGARPGAFVWIGNGASAGLHHPDYDFDDSAIPFGISFWGRLAELAMPRRS